MSNNSLTPSASIVAALNQIGGRATTREMDDLCAQLPSGHAGLGALLERGEVERHGDIYRLAKPGVTSILVDGRNVRIL